MQDFEKLGSFYLGRPYDLKNRKPKEGLLLYDSKDLVTHAVCVGMTGSGKTGLCISLLEEAAIDGVPSIIIDPKGDLANLLLTFPDLKAEDFAPWINEEDAEKKGLAASEYLHPNHQFVLYRGCVLPVAEHLRQQRLAAWHELPPDIYLSGACLVNLCAVQNIY